MFVKPLAVSAVALVLSQQPAIADYAIVGPLKTSVCWEFGIGFCSSREIVGVEQAGRVFGLSMVVGAVDKHTEGRDYDLCTIFANGKNAWRLGPLDDPSKDIRPIALDKNGKPEFVRAEKMVFKCVKIRPLR